MNWVRGFVGVAAFMAILLLTGSAQSQAPPGPSVTFEIEFKKEFYGGQWFTYIRTKGSWSNLPQGASPKVKITEKNFTPMLPGNQFSRITELYTVNFETAWHVIPNAPQPPAVHEYESKVEPSYTVNGVETILPTQTKVKAAPP